MGGNSRGRDLLSVREATGGCRRRHGTIYGIGVAAFLGCVAILTVGRRIERTLEILNWVLVVTILGGFFILTLLFAPGARVARGGRRASVASTSPNGRFDPLPAGADFFLLGALVAYSGSGGVVNIVLSNWARDRGYGMGERAGYIPAAAAGERGHVAHTGFIFAGDRQIDGPLARMVAHRVGRSMGSVLDRARFSACCCRRCSTSPSCRAAPTFRGSASARRWPSAIGSRTGAGVGAIIAFLGAWLLFKTQLDNLEGMVRAIADILWTGSRRVRAWRGGDVRAVYYTVLAILVVWGLIAMRLAQPIVLLQLGANVAGADLRHRRPAPALHQYAAAATARAAADVATGRARRHDAVLRILRGALVRELVHVALRLDEPLG